MTAMSQDVSKSVFVSPFDSQTIYIGQDDKVLKVGLRNGNQEAVKPIPHTTNDLAQAPNGDLFAADEQITRITFNPDGTHAITTLDSTHGWYPEMGFTVLHADNNHLWAGTEIGLYEYDFTSHTLQPYTDFGAHFAQRSIGTLEALPGGRFWISAGNDDGILARDNSGQWQWDTIPFKRLPPTTVRCVYGESESITWIGTDDGLFRHDADVPMDYSRPPHIGLRSVRAGQDSLLPFYGVETPPVLDASLNDLYFSFSAPEFSMPERIRYSWKLEGDEENWSDWSKNTFKEYTNLSAGTYTFQVKARNGYLVESAPASFTFRVLAPWYLTIWAMVAYGLLLIAGIWLLVRWRIRRLLRAKAQLERVVEERTAEIRRQKEATEVQRDRAEESERVKKRFFANMTHELRTPLTMILGPVEQLITRTEQPGDRKDLDMVRRNGRRLLRLINQLLDISKVESDRMTLNAARRDLQAFCQDIVAQFQPYAGQKGLALTYVAEVGDPQVDFDPEKMEKVLFNLLSNAVKYTASGGSIALKLTEVGENEMQIRVKDSGEGIPEDDVPHVFDRFYQSEHKGDKATGTGIGLALTKELVELHGGEIDVTSIAGVGSEFTVRLPRRQESVTVDQTVSSESSDPALYIGTDAPAVQQAYAPDAEALMQEGARQVVLVIEDNPDVRTYIRSCLPEEFDVVEAENGAMGLEKAIEIVPDLVVTDIMMPEMDGLEMISHLKQNERTSHLPFVILTSKAAVESRLKGLETGAEAYLTKPFNPAELQIRIRKLTELRNRLREKYRQEVLLHPAPEAATSVEEEFLLGIRALIDRELANEALDVTMLAEAAGMSKVQLHRKFKALTDDTPAQFIRRYRLEIAKGLLEQRAGTVADIAFRVGFSSAAYFSKCFSDQFGTTPSNVLKA